LEIKPVIVVHLGGGVGVEAIEKLGFLLVEVVTLLDEARGYGILVKEALGVGKVVDCEVAKGKSLGVAGYDSPKSVCIIGHNDSVFGLLSDEFFE
jgi:hypothetical protein